MEDTKPPIIATIVTTYYGEIQAIYPGELTEERKDHIIEIEGYSPAELTADHLKELLAINQLTSHGV